jgi:hypothetical protein
MAYLLAGIEVTLMRTSASPQHGKPLQPRTRPVPTLPADRAFVVQLSACTATELARVSGRVEHVVTGRSAHFRSLDQLLAFIARWLKAAT